MRNPKTEIFYPFDFAKVCGVSAYVEPPHAWDEEQITQYRVGWPSLGAVSVDDARQFAATIIKACDWLDAQKEAEPQRPVVAANVDIDVPGDRKEL